MKTRLFIVLWSLALLIGALTLGDGLGAIAGILALALVLVDFYERARGEPLETDRYRG